MRRVELYSSTSFYSLRRTVGYQLLRILRNSCFLEYACERKTGAAGLQLYTEPHNTFPQSVAAL